MCISKKHRARNVRIKLNTNFNIGITNLYNLKFLINTTIIKQEFF